jgi:hypothetical protein
MGTWFNPDGLFVKFGTDKTITNRAGEYRTLGALRDIELKIDLTALTTTGVIQSDQTFIPDGYRLEEVEVVAQTAATSGGAPTLDIGLVRNDRTTVVSQTTFVAALAMTAIDAAGEKNVLRVGSTGAGASMGAIITNGGYILARANTAAFTAGSVVIRIRMKKDV